MRRSEKQFDSRPGARGMTLVLVAIGMVVILGVCALAIDLASLYVARNEAQRAADAGALAGAEVYVEAGCSTLGSSNCTSTDVQTLATNRAVAAAIQNSIAGVAIPSACVSVTFPGEGDEGGGNGNPQITVKVSRATSCNNPMPTFFAKIFGIASRDISVTATAEAYNPSSGDPGKGDGSGPTICAACLKPLAVPNCDSVHTSPSNSACSGGTFGYFVDPTNGIVEHPGTSPAGVVGQQWMLHRPISGTPESSRWYPIDVGCGTTSSAFGQCLTQCAPQSWACGQTPLNFDISSFGVLDSTLNSMIHANSDGPTLDGQDSIVLNLGGNPPYTFTGGSNNPNSAMRGVQNITTSDSLITVAIYNGTAPVPGNGVMIVGYIQLFVQYVQHCTVGPGCAVDDDFITATILNVAGCGSSVATCATSGQNGTVTGGGAGMLPVRLIQRQAGGG
jgi:hypothetical protein